MEMRATIPETRARNLVAAFASTAAIMTHAAPTLAIELASALQELEPGVKTGCCRGRDPKVEVARLRDPFAL
jgi:hypothetical protein